MRGQIEALRDKSHREKDAAEKGGEITKGPCCGVGKERGTEIG